MKIEVELPYPAEGIILASDKYREKDRLLTIYTKEFGKIRAISRGSRKMSSKLSPHLESLTRANLMLVNGKAIATLTGAAEIKNFRKLKSKGAYALLALYLAELVDKVTPENLPEERIFNLFVELLEYLDNPQPKLTMPEIALIFKLKLLEFLGLRPAEIADMPPAVLGIIRLNFSDLENIVRTAASKQKLAKVLDRALIDILNQPVADFGGYVSLFKEQKVV